MVLILLGCSTPKSGSFEDNCERQGGHWQSNPGFTIEVPVIKDGTVVTVKRITTQEYCQL